MGPLAGITVIEIKGIGPGPYAGMLLADLGADVIVVERSSQHSGIGVPADRDICSRGKRSIALDLKKPGGLQCLLRLVERADLLFECFRPGVAERLGFGPDECLARNPALVYGRLTGWGQHGPLAQAAGHDINYIALTGALAAVGRADKPVPPSNLLGDYASGSLFLVLGMLAALIDSRASGRGQVVDAAITDGSASLMTLQHTLAAVGMWRSEREANLIDGGAHFYDVYETADNKFVSIGAIEPQFYALLIELAGLDPQEFTNPQDTRRWPELKQRLCDVFRTQTQAQWCERMEGTDVCFAPVLDYTEAPRHPHNKARSTFLPAGNSWQAAPAPRFSRTPAATPSAPRAAGADTETVLREAGFDVAEIQALKEAGALT